MMLTIPSPSPWPPLAGRIIGPVAALGFVASTAAVTQPFIATVTDPPSWLPGLPEVGLWGLAKFTFGLAFAGAPQDSYLLTAAAPLVQVLCAFLWLRSAWPAFRGLPQLIGVATLFGSLLIMLGVVMRIWGTLAAAFGPLVWVHGGTAWWWVFLVDLAFTTAAAFILNRTEIAGAIFAINRRNQHQQFWGKGWRV